MHAGDAETCCRSFTLNCIELPSAVSLVPLKLYENVSNISANYLFDLSISSIATWNEHRSYWKDVSVHDEKHRKGGASTWTALSRNILLLCFQVMILHDFLWHDWWSDQDLETFKKVFRLLLNVCALNLDTLPDHEFSTSNLDFTIPCHSKQWILRSSMTFILYLIIVDLIARNEDQCLQKLIGQSWSYWTHRDMQDREQCPQRLELNILKTKLYSECLLWMTLWVVCSLNYPLLHHLCSVIGCFFSFNACSAGVASYAG
jgi:hypothetical protein